MKMNPVWDINSKFRAFQKSRFNFCAREIEKKYTKNTTRKKGLITNCGNRILFTTSSTTTH